jgi:hypothetical protein
MNAMLQMSKIDIDGLQKADDGEEVASPSR